MKPMSKQIKEAHEIAKEQKEELDRKYPNKNYPEQVCIYCGNVKKPTQLFALKLSDVEPPYYCQFCDKLFGENPLTQEEKIETLKKTCETFGFFYAEDWVQFVRNKDYMKFLFDHRIAKIIFGTEYSYKSVPVRPDPHIVGSSIMGTRFISEKSKPVWMVHLEKMVTEHDPIKYLKTFLERREK